MLINKIEFKLFCLIVFSFVFLFDLKAEVFRLKNEEFIEGDIVSEDKDSFSVKTKYGLINLEKAEVLSLETKSLQDITLKTYFTQPSQAFFINTPKEKLYSMGEWLSGQIYPKTGLAESFRPTSDVYLEKQGATYDQALVGIAFLVLGEAKKAKAILDFYKSKWKGKGFCNFYFIPTGNPGIESIAHLGSNMWIALLALHYDSFSGKKQYQGFAEDMVEWAMSLNHFRGGAVMSDKDEWRAPWSKIVSTENNIDYYVVLDMLEKRVSNIQFREKIHREKLDIIDFFKKTAYDVKTGGVNRGFHTGVVDSERALDTISWLIAALGVNGLRDVGINPDRLIAFAENNFLTVDEGIKGFDFTDREGVVKAKRQNMISFEWTFGMVNAYCIYANYFRQSADKQKQLGNLQKANKLYNRASVYEHKALFFTSQMDKKMMKFGEREDLYAYPYATRSYWLVFFDSLWWKTPKADMNGNPPGSIASTAWRIFAGNFNPLNNEGRIN
jgi:hypothetical protein